MHTLRLLHGRKGVEQRASVPSSLEALYASLIQATPETRRQPTILLTGVCRSSTTATLISFAKAGYPGLYQPAKNAFRYQLSDEHPYCWSIPLFPDTNKPLIIKETIGPYMHEEVFDPLEVYRQTGLKNLSTVLLVRDPIDSWESWLRKFNAPSLSVFIQAYQRQIDILNTAIRQSIPWVVVDHSAYAMKYVERNMRQLCSLLKLPFTPSFVDWKDADDSRTIIENVPEPQAFAIRFKGTEDDHGNPVASTWTKPQLGHTNKAAGEIPPLDRETIITSGLSKIYMQLKTISQHQGFELPPS